MNGTSLWNQFVINGVFKVEGISDDLSHIDVDFRIMNVRSHDVASSLDGQGSASLYM